VLNIVTGKRRSGRTGSRGTATEAAVRGCRRARANSWRAAIRTKADGYVAFPVVYKIVSLQNVRKERGARDEV
jgi:hypothetical protein